MFNVRKNNLQNYGICPWVGRRIIFHMMSNPQDFRTERNIILQMRKEKKKLDPKMGKGWPSIMHVVMYVHLSSQTCIRSQKKEIQDPAVHLNLKNPLMFPLT